MRAGGGRRRPVELSKEQLRVLACPNPSPLTLALTLTLALAIAIALTLTPPCSSVMEAATLLEPNEQVPVVPLTHTHGPIHTPPRFFGKRIRTL